MVMGKNVTTFDWEWGRTSDPRKRVEKALLAHQVSVRSLAKRSIAGKHHTTKLKFTLQIVEILALTIIIISWFCVLLVVSGDVHPNSGPFSASSSNSSLNTTNMSSSILSSLNLSSHLTSLHFNVQSIVPKSRF